MLLFTFLKFAEEAREGEKNAKDMMYKVRDIVGYKVLHIGPGGPFG